MKNTNYNINFKITQIKRNFNQSLINDGWQSYFIFLNETLPKKRN